MTIATGDQALAAASGQLTQDLIFFKNFNATINAADTPWHSWTYGDQPAAGSYTVGAVKTATQLTKSTTGALQFTNPGGSNVLHVQAFGGQIETTTDTNGGRGGLYLIDQLVQYQGCLTNTAAAQAMTNSGANMLPRYTNALGVMMMAVVQTAIGTLSTGTTTVTVTYDDENGNSSTTTFTLPASQATVGRLLNGGRNCVWIPISDRGIKRITQVQNGGTYSAGTYCLILFKIIAVKTLRSDEWAEDGYAFSNKRVLPVIQTDACLDFIYAPGGTVNLSAGGFNGQIATLEG